MMIKAIQGVGPAPTKGGYIDVRIFEEEPISIVGA